MSYCRFGKDSDVYMYMHVLGHIDCCGCSISQDGLSVALYSKTDALFHLVEHIIAGDAVLPRALSRLLNEIREERKVNNGNES